MSDLVNTSWPETTIKSSSYLKGRIGWQGLRASEFTDDGPYLITGTDFHDGKIDWSSCYHVTEERFREGAYIHVRNGDLLITKDGTIGKVAYVTDCPDKAVLNSGIFLLRCIDGTYDHRFLYHLLNSPVFEKFLRLNLAGSTINHLYQNVFERFQFPIPDIKLQHRIAEILSTLDEAIEQTEALIAKMQQVKAGLMHDLFARGVTPDGRLRTTREQAPELYKESPLGWIPKEWDTVFLRDYVSLLKSGLSRRIEEQDIGIPVITSGNIKDGQFDRSELRYWYVNDPQGADTSKYTLDDKDILLNFINSVDQIGKLCIFRDIGRQCIYTTNLFRVKCSELTDQDFLYRILGSPHVQAEIKAITKPAINQASFTTGDLLRIRVQLLPPAEQSLICITLEQIDNSIVTQQQNLRKLELIKHGLMRDLLSGRVTMLSENCQ